MENQKYYIYTTDGCYDSLYDYAELLVKHPKTAQLVRAKYLGETFHLGQLWDYITDYEYADFYEFETKLPKEVILEILRLVDNHYFVDQMALLGTLGKLEKLEKTSYNCESGLNGKGE